MDEEKELQHLMSRANSSRDRLVGTSGHFDEETRAAKYMRTTPGAVGPSLVKHKYDEVDHAMLKKVFLHFVKVINENVVLRKSYLVEDGKQGRLQCIACRRFDQYKTIVILYFFFFFLFCVGILLVFIAFDILVSNSITLTYLIVMEQKNCSFLFAEWLGE